jgi:hypothetical protein
MLLMAVVVAHGEPYPGTVCADAVYSRVPGPVMRSAAVIARDLFEQARVLVEWKLAEAGQRTPIGRNIPCDNADVRIVVVASRFDPRGGPPDMLGEASLRGNVVAYYHRIEKYARRTRIPADVLLGYVLAHEIGHVLLRSQAHAADGLMRSEWRPHELSGIADRRLRFDSGESSGLQAALRGKTLARITGAGAP